MSSTSEKDRISIKGTRMGILVSMSEEGPFAENLSFLDEKMHSTPQFFKGSPLSLDLGWREITPEDLKKLNDFLSAHNIQLQGIISSSLATRNLAESQGIKVIIGRLGIADHYSRTSKKEAESPRKASAPQEETMMLRKTVRSGQKIDFKGNVVIQGDVNAGAEIIATGDIIVLGALRGLAHAGAEGSESAVVVALMLEPTQLRIASHIAITKTIKASKRNCGIFAKVEGQKIVLSQYSAHF
jgi:septum site-determining protein MinC